MPDRARPGNLRRAAFCPSCPADAGHRGGRASPGARSRPNICPHRWQARGPAAVTVAGALDGWYSTVPPGRTFDNRIAAMDVLGIAPSSAKRGAAKIKAPLLVCVSRRETLDGPTPRRRCRPPRHRAAWCGTTTAITSRSITRRCWLRCSPIKPTFFRSTWVSGSANALRDNDTRLAELARDPSARRNGPSRACAPNGPIMKCWPISSIGYGAALSASHREHAAASRVIRRGEHRSGPQPGGAPRAAAS